LNPHSLDYILFYEYFHVDNGAGIGANHQTGWAWPVAHFIQMCGSVDKKDLLANSQVFQAFKGND